MTPEDPAPRARDGLEAFAALAAHQLGEAVALMRGAASVLAGEQARLGVGGQDALRALNAGGDRAQRYVDDLLDIVRAGSEPEAPAAADLDPALDAAVGELEPFLRRGPGVKVHREPLPRVPMEAREAERLLTHLLRGAIAAGATQMLFTGRAEAGGIIIEVLDDATPLPEDGQPFAPFATPRGRGPLVGAGVSLPVCRALVERRGGTIAHARRADGATVITVALPALA
jgi:signal transduction histidine kinase